MYLRYKDKEKRKAYLKAYRLKNKDRFRLYSKKWSAEKYKEYYEKNKRKILENHEKNRKLNLSKNRARNNLQYHVKKGNIERKPCIRCGEIKSEAHHKDYSKQLEVIWLCRKHHMELHRKYSLVDL